MTSTLLLALAGAACTALMFALMVASGATALELGLLGVGTGLKAAICAVVELRWYLLHRRG